MNKRTNGMSMTVEETIKQAIRCAVGGCSEDCPYCDSDNVCHASEGFAENLEKALSEFRELKEKATAKKPAYQGEHEKCPTCGSFHLLNNYCCECGRRVAMDWLVRRKE